MDVLLCVCSVAVSALMMVYMLLTCLLWLLDECYGAGPSHVGSFTVKDPAWNILRVLQKKIINANVTPKL